MANRPTPNPKRSTEELIHIIRIRKYYLIQNYLLKYLFKVQGADFLCHVYLRTT